MKRIESTDNPYNILVDKDLVSYYEFIFRFYQELGKVKGTPKKISTLTTLLMIFQDLTQKQLQALTGYSLTSISNTLNVLQNVNFVEKIRIPGTHTFQYHMPPQIENAIKQSIIRTHHLLKDTITYFRQVHGELTSPQLNQLQGASYIQTQLKVNIKHFEFVNHVLENFLGTLNNQDITEMGNLEKQYADVFKPKNFPEKYIFRDLDAIIAGIEKQIISHLQKSIFQPKKGTSKALLMPYFITREFLTQKDLKKISKLSVGQISGGLKELTQKNLCGFSTNLLSNPKSNRPIKVYYIKSLPYSLIYRLRQIFDKIFEFKPSFLKMQKELKQKKSEWNDKNGFNKILKYFTEFVSIITKYEEFNNYIQEIEQFI
ncbi:hypothetical protein [Candidatus Lokiarchaeum ossiferum]